jgi:hypothetical protein
MRGKVTGLFGCLLLLLTMTSVSAADLKITDSTGTTVVVTGAAIDYGGFLASDLEAQGIRVLQGDGTVTVKWVDVDTITVTGKDESIKPPRLKLEIALRGGRKVQAVLLRQGQMKLRGKTELGEYTVDLEKIRSITPAR